MLPDSPNTQATLPCWQTFQQVSINQLVNQSINQFKVDKTFQWFCGIVFDAMQACGGLQRASEALQSGGLGQDVKLILDQFESDPNSALQSLQVYERDRKFA